ncbi:MAG: DUF373 family protein [archaeon]|nr:DUF373 family protein [archaeon]
MAILSAEQRPSKLLVLSVDRDDDIGVKAKVKTPVIGRDACIAAATKLSIADPEEADANAIFAAVKQYDELVSKGHECEVAAIAGSSEEGVEADQKLRAELVEVISRFGASGMILVSDGFDDRAILPILLGVGPVISVRRVVIKHSKSLEESYAVLGRYLKMLVSDPKYSKFSLGVPGLLLLVTGLLSLFNLLQLATQITSIILGIALMAWGFDLLKYATSIRKVRISIKKMSPSSYIRLFSVVTTLLVISVAFYQAFISMSSLPQYLEILRDFSLILKHGPLLFGWFMKEAIPLTWIGLSIYLGCFMITNWMRKSIKIWQDAFALIVLAFLYIPLLEFSQILINPEQSVFTLISQLLLGLIVTFLVAMVAYRYIRYHRKVRRRA